VPIAASTAKAPGLMIGGSTLNPRPWFHLAVRIKLYIQFRQYKMFLKEHFTRFCKYFLI